MKYAVSIIAVRFVFGKIDIRGHLGIVNAENQDEAVGIAWRFAWKRFPKINSWRDHSVVVLSVDVEPLDPDEAFPIDDDTLYSGPKQ
jgi:hypothetical protein